MEQNPNKYGTELEPEPEQKTEPCEHKNQDYSLTIVMTIVMEQNRNQNGTKMEPEPEPSER